MRSESASERVGYPSPSSKARPRWGAVLCPIDAEAGLEQGTTLDQRPERPACLRWRSRGRPWNFRRVSILRGRRSAAARTRPPRTTLVLCRRAARGANFEVHAPQFLPPPMTSLAVAERAFRTLISCRLLAFGPTNTGYPIGFNTICPLSIALPTVGPTLAWWPSSQSLCQLKRGVQRPAVLTATGP